MDMYYVVSLSNSQSYKILKSNNFDKLFVNHLNIYCYWLMKKYYTT